MIKSFHSLLSLNYLYVSRKYTKYKKRAKLLLLADISFDFFSVYIVCKGSFIFHIYEDSWDNVLVQYLVLK